MLVCYLILLETAPKIKNNSKFTKEQEMFANWTTDGAKHQLNKNWYLALGINGPISWTHRTQNISIYQISKSISTAEPNYFVYFAMRYPVVCVAFLLKVTRLFCWVEILSTYKQKVELWSRLYFAASVFRAY